ncbi:hypothetical protein FA13DRAFT_1181915 [Coprinellus micaceus]|uniref:Uncharacterized protein n=1 Tax=Coprinellus micaceus TaxID=71717 RepID=A0A4Y7RC25_COPMI|nr:hypothetical protein FA13DRAFT_1181915 [Coprinellus micaceus]
MPDPGSESRSRRHISGMEHGSVGPSTRMTFYPNEIAGVCFPPSPIRGAADRRVWVVPSTVSRLHRQWYRELRGPMEPYREYTSPTAGEKPRNAPGRTGEGECECRWLPQMPTLFCSGYAMGACPGGYRCDRLHPMVICEGRGRYWSLWSPSRLA